MESRQQHAVDGLFASSEEKLFRADSPEGRIQSQYTDILAHFLELGQAKNATELESVDTMTFA